ncbi:MAG: hypothetical protein A2017_13970 [Lentisphaerae bacterium GWF2_44_16]|nr:MAG: hypothetical protein A2017_13970 [Lentisphaerae bacterium GWF2_44_16]
MKIMIMTDMEGCAGILNFKDWVTPEGRYYEKGKRFLTAETNAAIDGFFAGGATEVVILDGHGHGGIDPELLDERALLRRGHSEKVWPWGMDKSFSALACVGQHAKAGTPYSHLTHTQNCGVIDYRVNGLSIGEYGQLALCAMELGIPCILACGEKAFTKEAEELTPGVLTVAVKEGLLPDDGFRDCTTEAYENAKLSAIHLSPGKVVKMIRETAFKAIEKLKKSPNAFHFPKLSPPYRREVEFRASSERKTQPYSKSVEHPDSIIELMNIPW